MFCFFYRIKLTDRYIKIKTSIKVKISIFCFNTYQMATKTGIGYSTKSDSFAAGVEASINAINAIDASPLNLVIIFCSGKHDPYQFLTGVISNTGDTPLIGGTAIGIFTNTELGYEGYEASVTVFSSASIQFQLFSQPDLDKGEYAAGVAIGEQINNARTSKDKGLLVFYDTIKQVNPPMLNFATPLFTAIEERIDPAICCAGAGILGDVKLTNSFQFFNGKVLQQHVLALLISGNCMMYNTIMHGCKPGSSYKTITRAEGPVVYEIDNRPAIDVIEELFGADHKIPWNEFPFFVTLGLNRGDKYGDFNEAEYANRLCLAIDPTKKALVMFEPDLKAGDEIQLMHRSINLDYIHTGIDVLRKKAGNKKPLFYFYINCGGRAKPFAGGELEDVTEVQKIIGNDVPFTGFYSGVEVAKLGNHLQALDWTGVLCLLTEEEE